MTDRAPWFCRPTLVVNMCLSLVPPPHPDDHRMHAPLETSTQTNHRFTSTSHGSDCIRQAGNFPLVGVSQSKRTAQCQRFVFSAITPLVRGGHASISTRVRCQVRCVGGHLFSNPYIQEPFLERSPSRLSLFESVYFVMHWSDSTAKKEKFRPSAS
jgi:hypothetical protein